MFDFGKSPPLQKTTPVTVVDQPVQRTAIAASSTALETLWPGIEHSQPAAERDTRYGGTNVVLPTYPRPAPMIISTARENGTTYHIFMLAQITQKPEWTQAVADIVHILDYATTADVVMFHIASPGGVFNVAARIVAAMQRTVAHTITRAVGLVASAGSFIWSYGKERQMVPGAVLMFHMSKHGDCGHTPTIAENALAFTAYVRSVAFSHLIRDGVLTEEEVDDIVARRREIYLSYADVQQRMGVGHV